MMKQQNATTFANSELVRRSYCFLIRASQK